MNTVFTLLAFISLIAVPVYAIKWITTKNNRPQVKKKLLISAAVFIVSFIGFGVTTPSEEPIDNNQIAQKQDVAEPTAPVDAKPVVDNDPTQSDHSSKNDPAEEQEPTITPDSDKDAIADLLPAPKDNSSSIDMPTAPARTPVATPEPADVANTASQSPVAPKIEQVTPPEPKPQKISATYIGNSNTKKFHYASCSSAEKISASNRVEFDSADEAKNAGYVPCKRCNP